MNGTASAAPATSLACAFLSCSACAVSQMAAALLQWEPCLLTSCRNGTTPRGPSPLPSQSIRFHCGRHMDMSGPTTSAQTALTVHGTSFSQNESTTSPGGCSTEKRIVVWEREKYTGKLDDVGTHRTAQNKHMHAHTDTMRMEGEGGGHHLGLAMWAMRVAGPMAVTTHTPSPPTTTLPL